MARVSPDRLAEAERLVAAISRWAQSAARVSAGALVGSFARGDPREDSDVDLMLLVENPALYRANSWIGDIDWRGVGVAPSSWRDVACGVAWSRHLLLDSGLVVELSFAPLSWSDIEPVDAGTRGVVGDGCRILFDLDGRLERLVRTVRGGTATAP